MSVEQNTCRINLSSTVLLHRFGISQTHPINLAFQSDNKLFVQRGGQPQEGGIQLHVMPHIGLALFVPSSLHRRKKHENILLKTTA